MSSLASSSSPIPSRADWISPAEQLRRLYGPIAKEVTQAEVKGAGKSFSIIPDLAKMVAAYAVDASLTNWHTSLDYLKTLPSKIPPLPHNIDQILEGKCPIYSDQLKSDGTPFKIKDTHFLTLVSEEFGSLNHLEKNILKPYGEQQYRGGRSPLQFREFWDKARKEHGDVSFLPTHWVLMTKDVLPGSRGGSWEIQVQLVDELRKKALVNYEVPTLQQSFAAITAGMVATGKMRYGTKPYTFTRVQEKTNGFLLHVGGFSSSGGIVSFDFGSENIGVAALRKF